MIAHLRALDPGQPVGQILFYRFGYWLVMAFFTLLYRYRIYHAERVPAVSGGGLLVVANHQSHYDPPLVGAALRRRNMAAIARAGLFRVPLLGTLLRWVGCIELKEDESDAAAMRRAITELKKGRVVVIFPEGSRSPDGEVHQFKRGAWLLLSRAGCDVIPAAVEGPFDAWPRCCSLPRLFSKRFGVAFGDVVPYAELKAMGPDEGLALLRERVLGMQEELRARLRERPKP